MFFLLMLNRWILRSTSICATVNWILFCWVSRIKQCPFSLSIENFKVFSNGAGMRFCIVSIYLSGASFKRGLWKGDKNHSVVLLLEYQRSTVASISLDWRGYICVHDILSVLYVPQFPNYFPLKPGKVEKPE